MSQGGALVSIIVRTKDRPELLMRNLRSIAAQDYRPIEVVLVNDGGRELSTEAIVDVLGDVGLNYVWLKQNVGRSAAANTGIGNAAGRYVCFLDDDDEFHPTHVSTIVGYLQGAGALPVAYTDSEIVNSHFDGQKGVFVVKERSPFLSEDFSYDKLLLGNYIPLMCLMFTRDVLGDVEFDTGFDLYEDWDMLIRLARKHPFYHIKKITTKYNRHMDEQITEDIALYRNAFIKLAEKHMGEFTPEALFMNWECIIKMREVYLELLRKLEEKDGDVKNLQESLRRRQMDVEELTTYLEEFRVSLGWQAVEAYRRFKDRLLPMGSGRRRLYDLMLKSVKVIKGEGLKSFITKVKRRLRLARPVRVELTDASLSLKHRSGHRPVDIILPVYNGFDYLVPCVQSVLRHTDLENHGLVIIDDCSTDPRIGEYLKGFDAGDLNVQIKYNDKNMGFVKTVNAGMRASGRDVILLNSDTVVTSGWVGKLRRAAYSKPRVASVTPFSNNATLCSVPRFFENNPIPDGFTLDEFAAFIEDISLRYYPEIPSSVGFCNYIRREVLEETGFFDEKNFGSGYGEECEFCARTIKQGFVHILDDTTYIYHKGGVSFTMDVKTEQESRHLEVLDRLHPWYLPMAHKFFSENPLRGMLDYIELRISIRQGEPGDARQETLR